MERSMFKPVLRIGGGPWYTTGHVCRSYQQARAMAAMFTKWWLGVAESDVDESESIAQQESLVKLTRTKRKRNVASSEVQLHI